RPAGAVSTEVVPAERHRPGAQQPHDGREPQPSAPPAGEVDRVLATGDPAQQTHATPAFSRGTSSVRTGPTIASLGSANQPGWRLARSDWSTMRTAGRMK